MMPNPNTDRVLNIRKEGMVVPMSFELAFQDRFPQRVKVTELPITDERTAAYKVFRKRWKRARKEWNAVQQLGVGEGWSTYESEDEAAELLPLEPQQDIEFLETYDEWAARVHGLVQHHADTGEWLEQPEPTLHDLIMGFVALPGTDKENN